MTINRTTISGIYGLPQGVTELHVESDLRQSVRNAALAAVAIGLLLLLAL
jgi:hypothetical protein